ncbi:phenylacetate-CoA oxygenase subunit PaaI [Actinobacteria bacterium YIM 96077]|uniref:Phenylacetate-CoA oxygenase subunit PaaI n=1 Tax=Phytoactinopolyspora halophila TaxID=1981511 RepID=A0A329QVP1_9ACTN|nr:1,2-phenylacetyl-CoA epoxidase subunit PaaC [Phytoactinopolyspora halophila]AYY14914.1 phenylacetate-CoA oxygenase subunit PaaI [Actinobacteria bacterium YIM 96077]RAW15372.1 phenylacetate-CoA oxygenase subunit PaaI [Phytoactinopolyspora halophila]
MGFDNAYEALTEGQDDARWAFGTGFEDPLSGVDTTLPDGVDGADLAAYCVMLGDDALIMSHRLQQWCTWLPELEEEVAVANIALDLLGQARLLLTRAGAADGGGHGEDYYAFFRPEHEFRNVRLVELENGDFAELVTRLLVFSTWRLALLDRLRVSRDPVLAAIAAKGVKEITYHRDYAAQWTVRLGDGTDESHRRMRAALEAVWPYVDELFTAHPVEQRLAVQAAEGNGDGARGGDHDTAPAVAIDPGTLRSEFDDVLAQVLKAASLERPEVAPIPGVAGKLGRDGVHTEAMGYLLAEMQSVARAHPEGRW